MPSIKQKIEAKIIKRLKKKEEGKIKKVRFAKIKATARKLAQKQFDLLHKPRARKRIRY